MALHRPEWLGGVMVRALHLDPAVASSTTSLALSRTTLGKSLTHTCLCLADCIFTSCIWSIIFTAPSVIEQYNLVPVTLRLGR